jgi:large subunit ribosomal protein L29
MAKAGEVHGLPDDELVKFVGRSRQEVFNLRFQHATGQLENTARMTTAKRDLARGLTVARQRGIDVERELRRQEAETNA